MKINELTPDSEILRELGQRLAKIRKQSGFSQQKLAKAAGIGVATLKRIEGGQDSHMESWLKLLKALGLSQTIDAFLPEYYSSPMADVLATKGAPRNRSATKARQPWADESA